MVTRTERYKKQRKKKRTNITKIIIYIIILLILGFITGTLIKNKYKTHHQLPGPREYEEWQIAESIESDDEEVDLNKYEDIQNILLIGVDEGGYDNARSDVMIVATIDKNDSILKLTSIMRDTLSYIPTSSTYQKLNHSYMEGGPEETMEAVNKNLDLDIDNYVVFDYDALITAVDFVGGYPADVNEGEAYDLGIEPGEYTLKGKQALDYMRVRKNSGGDTGRNQRQRDFIFHVMENSKEMSKAELVRFASKMLPKVRTSYSLVDTKEMIDLYMALREGLETEQYSFPSDYEGTLLADGLWYAVPRNMKTNVTKLQENIYGEENYNPSYEVETISAEVESKSGITLNQGEI